MDNEFINPFQEIILQHPKTLLRAHIIPLGLNVTRLGCQDPIDGSIHHDVIVGPESTKDHWELGRKFLGPIIGRYANRLPIGLHKFDDGKHLIDIPEFSANGVCLHGGPENENYTLPKIKKDQNELILQSGPFDRLVWQKLSSNRSQFFGTESPSIPSGSSAIFGILSKGDSNGDGKSKGFPGNVRIEVRLAIILGNNNNKADIDLPDLGKSMGKFRMEYRACLIDQECESTPINITHHWAFNLSSSDPFARKKDQGKIDNHTLRLFSHPSEIEPKLFTPSLDEKMVPNGSLIDCSNSPHDWTQKGNDGFGKKIIHQGSLDGYDHFYAWGGENSTEESLNNPRLLLHSPETKLSLTFYTNQSGVQVYTANGQPKSPAEAKAAGGAMKLCHADKGQENLGNAQRSGVALEFGHPHATFLHNSYAKLAKNDTILRKGEQYQNWLEVELSKRV